MQLALGVKHPHFPGLGMIDEQALFIGNGQIAVRSYCQVIAVVDIGNGALFKTVFPGIELIQACAVGSQV